MELSNLWNKSMLILGFGVEGLSSYKLLQELFPHHHIGIADQKAFEELPGEGQILIRSNPDVRLHLGGNYLASLMQYDVIVKSPGISPALPPIQEAVRQGKILTSHTDIFFTDCPGRIIGITGTKGKGTTSKLLYTMLRTAGFDTYLVGNIGTPPLSLLKQTKTTSVFVHELSAQQLEGLKQSPHIAVCLNIVPDHLDHFPTFEDYIRAKGNIACYQNENDYLVYNAAFTVPRLIAGKSKARRIAYTVEGDSESRCFVKGEQIIFSDETGQQEQIISIGDVATTLPGAFNLHNVLPSIAVAKLLGVETQHIVEAIKNYEPLENRFENIGTYQGITFYNASIATIPEVTIEHLKTLGADVQTMLLGGFDRGIDFSQLGRYIVEYNIRNLILFPSTGDRILQAIKEAAKRPGIKYSPQCFAIKETTGAQAMKVAVSIAYKHTAPGKICLHSPASPSFGLFRDFKERGKLFKEYVSKIGQHRTIHPIMMNSIGNHDLTGEK
jgi:UDP-N-acetylmuramoylalanine--D-glutamate ligase